MRTIVIDTHSFVKSFINAKTEEEKAEIIIRTINLAKGETDNRIEAKFNDTKSELATKNDLKQLELANKSDLKELEISTKRDLKELELKMDTKISDTKNELLKWMFGMFVAFSGGQLALLVLILKMFFKTNI